jgi:hypothetical protein
MVRARHRRHAIDVRFGERREGRRRSLPGVSS